MLDRLRTWIHRKRQRPFVEGRPVAVDCSAASADPGLPGFLARPSDAPIYHGFPVLDEVEYDGFRLGMITDFLAIETTIGDAFVVAPDGSRAGLVWESEIDKSFFSEVRPPDEGRWGVWGLGVRTPLHTVSDAQVFLETAVPLLRPIWEKWASLR